MTLKEDLWFPSIIWSDRLVDVDNSSIEDYSYQLMSSDSGVKISNCGGWQSSSLSKISIQVLDPLISKINERINQIVFKFELPKLKLYNMWINVNHPNDYNHLHNHIHSIVSGCYYVKIPKNSGNIEFYRSDGAEYFLPESQSSYNYFNSIKSEYQPINGGLLLFPGWLKHSVQRNRSNENRISISFNYGIVNEKNK